MTYNIKYVPAKDLERIQDEWKALETGEEMTLFQSYEWYQMLLEKYIPEDTKNPMSLMTGTKIDAHLESNKAAVDSIVDLVPEFASVRSLLVQYDKNNHVDKYVTNFVCDGIMKCTVNGTPLR